MSCTNCTVNMECHQKSLPLLALLRGGQRHHQHFCAGNTKFHCHLQFHCESPMRGTEKGTSIFINVAATQKLQSPSDPKMDKFHTLSHTDLNNLKGFFVSVSRTCPMTIHHVFPEQDLPMPPHLSRSRPEPMAAWNHRHWRRG